MTTARSVLAVALIVCSIPAVSRAQSGSISGPILTNNSSDGSASGCCPSCAQTKSTLGVVSQTPTTFTTRFAQIIAADSRLTTPIGIGLNSSYTVGFDAICPVGGYQLAITTRVKGAFTHVNDSLGCGVAGTADSNLSPITGIQSGGTLSGSLGLPDPGGVGGANSDVYQPFDLSDTATISGTSTGSPISHTLVFNWNGSCNSNATAFTCGIECAVRMGLAADSPLSCPTDNISADDYPGVGPRTATDDGHFVTVTLQCLCGNSVIDGGEQCDQGAGNGTSGSCCDLNCQLVPSGICRAAANECDIAEGCNGFAGDCPPNNVQPGGVPCSTDGNECTDDVCNGAGACSHPNKAPGASCNGGAGTCDGTGNCVAPPTPSPTPTPPPLCAATPRMGCRTPAVATKSSLLVRNKTGTLSDRLTWKWNRGAATTTAEFGSPHLTTNYALCIYDEVGNVSSLVASLRAPAGGICFNGRECWKSLNGRGFKYSNPLLSPDGLLKLLVKEGVSGKAKIVASAKGPYLTLPLQGNGKVLQQDTHVTVQVVNDAPSSPCWETRFTAPAAKNTLELFRDKD